ncbi:hypothetical protein D6C99_08227, partial [Aureobasidium pullulans]
SIVLFVTLVASFCVYGHYNFYRDPGSIFFDEHRAFQRQYSTYRQAEIAGFSDVRQDTHAISRTKKTASICASFPSVERQGSQYLPIAVASALQGLSDCERQDLFLNILIAHANTTEHPSTSLNWLADSVDSLHGYDVSNQQLEHLQELELNKDFSTKAVFDYIHALSDCYETQADWIIIFEDDILLADGWFAKTKQAVLSFSEEAKDDMLFMRLFNQERSTGWGSREVGGNHEFLISIAISLVAFAILTFLCKRSRIARKLVDDGTVFVVCILAIPTFVVLFFQAGKASMLPPHPGVRKERFGCCAQGLVFPRAKAPRVVEYLNAKQSGQIDLMLDDLAREDMLDRYALYPVQVQHIAHEAQAVWSMTFEDLDPKALRMSHAKMLKDLYPSECAIG